MSHPVATAAADASTPAPAVAGTQLVPVATRYTPCQSVTVELRAPAGPCRLTVTHLGAPVRSVVAQGPGLVDLGQLPGGGYGISTGPGGPRTAIEVEDPDTVTMRYGFVADYAPGRDVTAVADTIRRLHLTDVQFYDWAYRHADLLGGGQNYRDPLGQPIALDTVRRLIAATAAAGSRALGYAAVYAVGADEWPRWKQAALVDASGEPYRLADFLRLVDPADPTWLAHLVGQLCAAADKIGFHGFHLDQYGYPKLAGRADGTLVDLADSFAAVIAASRAALPGHRLVFNNVNDFPTWRTASSTQDAIYIEPWPPHVSLAHLAGLVVRARGAAATPRPIVVAAYQHVYATGPTEAADHAAALTMATLYSHGATQLLCGEADRVLIDPYYVRNHPIDRGTADRLTRWYDFAVEHGQLLFPARSTDLTGSLAGEYNDDCDVTYPAVPVTDTPQAGTIWRRISAGRDPGQLVLHLINLADQTDIAWDAARHPPRTQPSGTLRLRRAGDRLPRVRVADPDRQPTLHDVPVTADGNHATATLPPSPVWQLVLVDLIPANPRK